MEEGVPVSKRPIKPQRVIKVPYQHWFKEKNGAFTQLRSEGKMTRGEPFWNCHFCELKTKCPLKAYLDPCFVRETMLRRRKGGGGDASTTSNTKLGAVGVGDTFNTEGGTLR